MLTLTDRTERALLELIATGKPGTERPLLEAIEAGNPDRGRMLRLVLNAGELAVAFDVPHEDDHVIRHEGSPMLAVPRALEAHLEGSVVDCEETDDGFRLFARARS